MARALRCPFPSYERPKCAETVHRLKKAHEERYGQPRLGHELRMCADHMNACVLKRSERECAVVPAVCESLDAKQTDRLPALLRSMRRGPQLYMRIVDNDAQDRNRTALRRSAWAPIFEEKYPKTARIGKSVAEPEAIFMLKPGFSFLCQTQSKAKNGVGRRRDPL